MTVITGVSGSGKSSLAFDTIYAEGQRRYVESLSAYARQFLERMEKPAVDEIDGIAPAIAIRQKNTTPQPPLHRRHLHRMLRFPAPAVRPRGPHLLPQCGTRVERDTVDQVAQQLLALPAGSRWYALFPVSAEAHPDTQALRDHLFDLRKKGFNRLFQAGRTFEFSTPESLLDIDFSKPVFILVDRLAIPAEPVPTCASAWSIPSKSAIAKPAKSSSSRPPAAHPRLPCASAKNSPASTAASTSADPEPRLFSFNNPFGACPRCQGFGNTIDFDMDLVDPGQDRPSKKAPSIPGPSPNTAPGWASSAKPRAAKACA